MLNAIGLCTHYNFSSSSYYYYHYTQGTSFPEELEINKVLCLCPEWLRWGVWGLRNCQRIGQAHCVKTLNCHGNSLVQKRSFPRIGCAARRPPANLCQEMLGFIRQRTQRLNIIIIIIIIIII